MTISWSDLPHTATQAAFTIGALNKRGLIVRSTTEKGYIPTEAGIKLMAAADEKGMWNVPPPREKTNVRRNRK